MKLLLTLLFLTAWTSMSASAKWGPLPLKSLVEHSNCIVVAEFVSEDSRKTEGGRIDQLVTLKVDTIIKGTPPEQINVAGYEARICAPQFIFPTIKGAKYMLFLQKSDDQYEVLNGIFGALTITDNKVNWFTDETQMQSMRHRKIAELDAVITAIKHAEETTHAPSMTEVQAIEVLMNVPTFGFGGKKGQRERASDTAFQALLSNPSAKDKFTTLFEKGGTPAKLFALCALHSINPAAYEKLSQSFKPEEVISTQFGCLVDKVKVSEILKNISNGDYDADCKITQ